MSQRVINGNPNDHTCKKHQVITKTRVEALLSTSGPIDWNLLDSLLTQLKISTADESRCSNEDDPMGRLLLGRILSQQAPLPALQAVLRAFPDCLMHNPAAFFTACHFGASSEIVATMMRHTLRFASRYSTNGENDCPYPWIVSDLMTVEAVQALLEVFPQGVLQKSSLLFGYSPLDYFLRSPGMIEKQCFNPKLWSKFKLVLVAAECCTSSAFQTQNVGLSPAHVLLKRLLSYPGMLYVQVMDSFCNLASLVDSHSYHTRHRLFRQHARSPTRFVAIGAAMSF
jgi:hypothetical protein